MRRLAVLGFVVAVLAVLAIAQLVLPGIAEQRLRDRLARSGQVLDVEVHAFPAIKLLWHRADRIVVRLASYRSNTDNLGNLLSEAGDVGSLDASVTTLDTGLLTLRDAKLAKRGDQLSGSALVTEDDLRAAVPVLQSVRPIASGGGRLILRGTATFLGLTAQIEATVGAVGGNLVVQPNVPFGGLATITAFSNPHVSVVGVSATPVPGGFRVSGTARLR